MKFRTKAIAVGAVGLIAYGYINRTSATDPFGGEGVLGTIACTGESVTVNRAGTIELTDYRRRRIATAGIEEPSILLFQLRDRNSNGIVGEGDASAWELSKTDTQERYEIIPKQEGKTHRTYEATIVSSGPKENPEHTISCREQQ